MDNERTEICKYIQTNISKLCQTEIDEVFKILHTNKSSYTQNNNGVFVNLNWIDDDVMNKIHKYILFCLRSQTEINKHEMMKNMITDTIINKERMDEKTNENTSNESVAITSSVKISRVSSSMKFYLLKKRFQKKNISMQSNNINNVLIHEEYKLR
jgi:hypothetical protein